MSEPKKGCQKPANLTGEPQKCSPEQIRKCHGDAAAHACTEQKKEEKEQDH